MNSLAGHHKRPSKVKGDYERHVSVEGAHTVLRHLRRQSPQVLRCRSPVAPSDFQCEWYNLLGLRLSLAVRSSASRAATRGTTDDPDGPAKAAWEVGVAMITSMKVVMPFLSTTRSGLRGPPSLRGSMVTRTPFSLLFLISSHNRAFTASWQAVRMLVFRGHTRG